MTLRVEVHLHAGLLRYAPEPSARGAYVREFADDARVRDVLASFKLPTERRIIIGIDGESATADTPLRDGARVDLVPPIAGG
jgi:molybdopterin converting factor small subunit